MNEIIKQGIDSASASLTYWGIEKERISKYNKEVAINESHELTLENCETAIKAAEAELNTQLKIAGDLLAKNELGEVTEYKKYLSYLEKTVEFLQGIYDIYPTIALKAIINALKSVIAVVEKIIGLF